MVKITCNNPECLTTKNHNGEMYTEYYNENICSMCKIYSLIDFPENRDDIVMIDLSKMGDEVKDPIGLRNFVSESEDNAIQVLTLLKHALGIFDDFDGIEMIKS